MRAAWGLFLALSLSALAWGQASPSPPAGPAYAIFETELARSRAICARLAAISVELGTKLEASETTSTRLSSELAALRTELSALRTSLGTSSARSAELEEMLARSESSLVSLEASFAAYRSGAEAAIRRARREILAWKILAALGVGAGAAGIAWGAGR